MRRFADLRLLKHNKPHACRLFKTAHTNNLICGEAYS